MAPQLARSTPVAELHCHLGGAVTPAIMWGIAHAQGIRLPTKDYWEFREMITVSSRHGRSFDGSRIPCWWAIPHMIAGVTAPPRWQ